MIYCFDIDGTICSLVENSEYDNAEVISVMRTTINRLYDEGHVIKFMTARGCVSGVDWSDLTQRQLGQWGFKYHELIMNKKPHADLFIDDRGVDVNTWIKNQDKVTGFLAGTFDLIHPGYIKMFEDAKTICNHLIVALHVDPSKEREHKYKPINTIEDRKLILSSIKYVDEIVVYSDEHELDELIKKLKPNYRILGSDYIDKEITGNHPEVEIYYHNRNHDWSYSSFRKKVKENT